MADVVLHDEIVAAPHCSLNVPISRDRGFGVVRADLRELRAIKSALGGTVNDLILAASVAACAPCSSSAATT
jgi:Wax ester synthase-like Acyl-CoA acyltransferase domain